MKKENTNQHNPIIQMIFQKDVIQQPICVELNVMNQAKQICNRTIKTYFTFCEDLLKKKIQLMGSRQLEFKAQKKNIQDHLDRLQYLLENLNFSQYNLSIIQQIYKIDPSQQIQRIISEYSNLQKYDKQFNFNINVSDDLCFDIVQTLRNSIVIQNINYQTIFSNQQFLNKISKKQKIQKKLTLQDLQASKLQKNQNIFKNSTVNNKNIQKIKKITAKSNFNSNSDRKYLHLFQSDNRYLFFHDLQQPGSRFQKIKLDSKFQIPLEHRSISLPNGDLYLIGGKIHASLRSSKIFQFQFSQKSFKYSGNLKYGRSSHSICTNGRYIYIIGGMLINEKITNKCQRYEICSGKIQEIQNCIYAAHSFALSSFNSTYLYKFGGIGEKLQKISKIERYDEKARKWTQINPNMNQSIFHKLQICSSQLSIQIAENQIIIFGGYDQNDNISTQTYILEIEQKFQIIDLNSYELWTGLTLYNSNNPVIYNNMIYALQNLPNDKNDSDQIGIVVFDGRNWKSL